MKLCILNTTLNLRLTNIFAAEHQLSIEIVLIYFIVVNKDDFFDAEAEEVHDDDGAEAADSEAEGCVGGDELLVPVFDADLAVEDGAQVLGLDVGVLFHGLGYY